MTALLLVAAALLATATGLLIALAVSHLALARRERRDADAQRRMRPIAIELLEGTAMPPELSPRDRTALATAIGRFSRKLSGATSDRIGAYFRASGGLGAARAALSARRAWRRAGAAYELGDMACPEAVPDLLAALEDRNDEVREAAVRSLGRLREPAATEPLVASLLARRVPRGVAGAALLEMGAGAVPELRRIARHEDPYIRSIALTVIGLVGDSGDADLMLEAIADPAADVRATAARAMGRIGSSSAEPALEVALEDRVPSVRAAAATALGELQARPTVPRLIEVARTDRFRPARAAARAVGAIDPPALTAAAADPGAGAHLREAADLLAL